MIMEKEFLNSQIILPRYKLNNQINKMKNYLKLTSTVIIFLQINFITSQNSTVINVINKLNSTANIQFFHGDYFYYSDNYNLQQTNYLRRFNLDTKKDTILQTLPFGCDVTSNYYTSNCIIQGTVTIGNYAYVMMGANFYRFNLINNTWQALQNYPSVFNNYRSAIVTDGNNYIYVWGSRDNSGFSPVLSNQLWRYDIINDSWFLLSTAPVSDMSKSGIYKYPYLIFGGGTENWNIIRTFNLLTNSWATMPAPTLSGNWQNESYFEYDNTIYCLVKDCLNSCYFSLFSFNELSQTWTSIFLNNFSTNLNPGPGVFDAGGMLENFYKRNNIIYFSNNMFNNNPLSSGQCNTYDACNGQVSALSMKRQINLSIDSTSCYSTLDDSITIYYRIEFAGSFNASNTSVYLTDINNSNPLEIFSNSNFYSSNVTIQNKNKRIHKNYLNYFLKAYNFQNTDTIYSSNKFPVNNNIRYAPNGLISASPTLNFCEGQPIGSVLTITNTNASSYQWYMNNLPLTGQNAISYTATQVGNYYCQIKTSNGCARNTTPVTIQTIQPPPASITVAGSTTICQGSSVTLNANTGTGLTYQWKNNGTNIIGATGASYTATTAGSYAVVVTNNSNCSLISTTTSITVNPLPIVSLATITSPVCINNQALELSATPIGGSYSGIGVVGSNFDPAVSGSGTFIVSYTYTDANNCTASSSQTVVVNPCVGIEEIENKKVSIYPNPTINNITVELDASLLNEATIEIYDGIGKLILSEKIVAEKNNYKLNAYENGIYTVRILSDNKQIIQRIIKNQ